MSAGVRNSASPWGPSATASSQASVSGGALGRRARRSAAAAAAGAARPADRELVPLASARPSWPPKRAEGEGRGAAEVRAARRCRRPPARRRAGRGPRSLPTSSTAPAATAIGSQQGHGLAVEGRLASAPVSRSPSPPRSKRSRGPISVHSSPAAPSWVAERPVAEPEGEVVHRPRGRHPDPPEAGPPGPVLHRGLHPRRDDLDRCRDAGSALTAGDDHPDRRRVEAVAGVVDLRAVGDQDQGVDLGPQGQGQPGRGDAVDDAQDAVGLDRHVHVPVDVGDQVALAEAPVGRPRGGSSRRRRAGGGCGGRSAGCSTP